MKLSDFNLDGLQINSEGEVFQTDDSVRQFEEYLREETEVVFEQYKKASIRSLALARVTIVGS